MADGARLVLGVGAGDHALQAATCRDVFMAARRLGCAARFVSDLLSPGRAEERARRVRAHHAAWRRARRSCSTA